MMSYTVVLLIVFLGVFVLVVHQHEVPPSEKKKGDLPSNLRLLNEWGEQTDTIQRLYETAYKVLAAERTASFADLAKNAEIERLCTKRGILHLGGPMLGAVTPNGVSVWLRTVRPAEVEVRVTVDETEKSYGPVKSTAHKDLSVIVPVTGLKPLSRHPYRVLVDGNPITIPEPAVIVTAPEDTNTGKVRIAFGSCQHRWGLGNKAQADLIRNRKPAALLLYGDMAVQDRNNHLGLHRADYLLRDFFPAWQHLVAAVPVYATWDDHDYFDNDKGGIPEGYTNEDKMGVWEVFRYAWNNPSYGFGDEKRGVFLRTRIGPCDIIMVDNRYFRTPKNAFLRFFGAGKNSFLGDGQMKWLESQLLDCEGPFIILSCGTMWTDYVRKGKDSWGKWDKKGRERIFKLIEKNRIGGVLLISGDRHGARGFRIPRPSGFNFHEFEVASLGGRKGPTVTKPEWKTQFYGIGGEYAFGEFTIDATLPDPEVTFRLIRDDGTVLYEMKLKRSQLTPP